MNLHKLILPIVTILLLQQLTSCSKNSSGSGNTSATDSITTFAGNGTAGFVDGPGATAEFSGPGALAIDPQGNIYVIDGGNGRIRKITPAGVVTTLAGNGVEGWVDGPGATAEFNGADGIGVDGQGNVYIGEFINRRIRKITPDGVVSTLAGNGTAGSLDGMGTQAEFENPDAIAVDAQNNIYVGDFSTSLIRKITPAGAVTTIAGNAAGYADGPLATAMFYGPRGLAIDAQNNLYVVDCNNNRVRKITASGVVSTVAGSGIAGFADGAAAVAEFYLPDGGAVDAQGNIYIADQSNYRVRKITPSGTVTTIGGNGVPGYVTGIGANTEFNTPTAVVVDAKGNVYVGDVNNNRIRKIPAQ